MSEDRTCAVCATCGDLILVSQMTRHSAECSQRVQKPTLMRQPERRSAIYSCGCRFLISLEGSSFVWLSCDRHAMAQDPYESPSESMSAVDSLISHLEEILPIAERFVGLTQASATRGEKIKSAEQSKAIRLARQTIESIKSRALKS